MTRPNDLQIPVFYPDDDPTSGAGMTQADYDEGQTGADNLRSIAELIHMDTFARLEPEFQRRYIALCVAAWIEARLLLGVGTGWRSEAIQAANHARWPNQFAPVSASLHMRKSPRNVAYAIDTVPYDALGWAHQNCGRFHINYLDHIANERHHCQPIELPNSGTAYNRDPLRYSTLAAIRVDLPYLRTQSLDAWLTANDAITINGTPPPPPPEPTPDPEPIPDPEPTPPIEEDDDVKIYLAKLVDDPNTAANESYHLRRGDGNLATVIRANETKVLKGRLDTGSVGVQYHRPLTPTIERPGEPITTWADIPALTEDQLDLDVGYIVVPVVKGQQGAQVDEG